MNQVEPENGHSCVGGILTMRPVKNAGLITPAPRGVGPVTVAVLMRNTVVAAYRLQASYSDQFKNHQ
ncbi:MAG: hypothetical protein CL387_00655 [Acidiferrobacter sp.]|nr:hypothetical protein [Acidiferrobacter sp.]